MTEETPSVNMMVGLPMSSEQYEGLFRLALDAGASRDYQKAVNILLRITSETDRLPQAFLYLGRSYHALKQYEEAIRYLRYFVELCPEIDAGHFFLGRSYLAYEIPKLAVLELTQARRLAPENVQARALLGLAYLRIKRSDMAVETLAEAVELDSENSRVYGGYLNALLVEAIRVFRRGDLNLSRQMLEFLIDAGKEDSLTYIYLASIEKRSGNYAAALSHYSHALDDTPEDPLLRLQRIDMLYRSGRPEEAVAGLESLGIRPPSDERNSQQLVLTREMAVESYQKGHYRKAVSFAHRVIKISGPDLDMHLLMGESFRALGNIEKATNHFHRAVDFAPKIVEPRYGLIMCYWLKEEWSEMLQILRRIDRINPGDSTAAYYKALCLCRLNRPTTETVPTLREQIKRNSEDVHLQTALGFEFLKTEDTSAAARAFKKAITIDESHQNAHQGLIHSYELLEKAAESEEAYRSYLDRFPGDAGSRHAYIQLLLDQGKFLDAEKEINTHLANESSDHELQRLLAYCMRRSRKYREAAVVYRRLLQESPEDEELLRSLCFCLDQAGNRDTAIELLRRAFDYKPPSYTMRLILGVLYYKASAFEEALAQFREVISKYPKEWRALRNIGMIYKRMGVHDFAERYLSMAERLMPRVEDLPGLPKR